MASFPEGLLRTKPSAVGCACLGHLVHSSQSPKSPGSDENHRGPERRHTCGGGPPCPGDEGLVQATDPKAHGS